MQKRLIGEIKLSFIVNKSDIIKNLEPTIRIKQFEKEIK